jgi:hypothetical protein
VPAAGCFWNVADPGASPLLFPCDGPLAVTTTGASYIHERGRRIRLCSRAPWDHRVRLATSGRARRLPRTVVATHRGWACAAAAAAVPRVRVDHAGGPRPSRPGQRPTARRSRRGWRSPWPTRARRRRRPSGTRPAAQARRRPGARSHAASRPEGRPARGRRSDRRSPPQRGGQRLLRRSSKQVLSHPSGAAADRPRDRLLLAREIVVERTR